MDIAHYPPATTGLTRFTVVRIVLALLAVCLPVALVLIASNQIADKALRAYWPPLLATALGVAGYLYCVRKLEQRVASELGGVAFRRELAMGLGLGTLLFLAVMALAATGGIQWLGFGGWRTLPKSLTEMLFVAVIEEIVFRGVLLRITERAVGSWAALIVSALLFGLAHVPNDGVTALAVINTVVAGLLFGAAYLATRRLWLTIGIHFAWNFVSSGVFSVPTSGNPGHGLLQLQFTGPTWLTGGAYGLEASAATLVVLAVATAWLLRQARRAHHLAPRRGGKNTTL